jgi:hypothetical protein
MLIPGRRILPKDDLYTSPLARGGDGMFLRVEVIDVDGAPDVNVVVQTRNREDSWPGSTAGTLAVPNTIGVHQLFLAPSSGATGLKEELRLYVQGKATGTGFSIIRILPPLFFDAAVAP